MNHCILLVEDESDIAEVAQVYLEAQDYRCQWFDQGFGVVDWVREHKPSVIVLDLMLPGVDGLSICQQVRQFSDVPIIMTTAKVQEVDRLIGLEAGADDYVCKPYSVKELIARINAAVRRLDNRVVQRPPVLQLDEDRLKISYQQDEVELTHIEFKLFHLLFSHPERVYSRAQIIELVYTDYRDVYDRTVDSHIRNLRKKLSQFALPTEPIRSIYGAGYKFEMP